MQRKTPEVNPTPMQTMNNRIVMRSTCLLSGTIKTRFMSGKEIRSAGLGGIITSILLIEPLLKGIIGSGAGVTEQTVAQPKLSPGLNGPAYSVPQDSLFCPHLAQSVPHAILSM